MKHKVSELEGALLDAVVAKAEGMIGAWVTDPDTDLTRNYRPSSDWSDGGPIIEREGIWLSTVYSEAGTEGDLYVDGWIAVMGRSALMRTGSTPLIAAMRAYVASKFGDEVEL